jgi:capsular exopolysaccharide synthesis family protein
MPARPNHSSHVDLEELDAYPDFAEPAAPGPDRSMKTKRLLLDLLGRWYWVALGLIIGVLGAAYYLSKAPKKYSSTATLLIKQNVSTVISRDQVEEIDMRSVEGLNTVAERLRRLELLERVASRMDVRSLPGLVPPPVNWKPEWLNDWTGKNTPEPATTSQAQPPPPPVLGSWLGSWMDVSIRRGTRLMDITFTHEVPEVAKALADAVVREYLAEIAGALTEGRSTKTDTLLRQSEEARGKLQSAESAMATYTRALELLKALDDREANLTQLARRYLPKHPRMIEATGDLQATRARFMDEFEIATKAPADASYWQTVAAEIEKVKDDPEARLRSARQLLIARTGVLRGEITSQMSVFNAMLTRIEESNVNSEGEESSAEVSSFARVPGGPSSPNAKKIHTQGIGMGLAAGLALAFLLVRLDNKFHSVAQVEAETSQPVLAAISDIEIRHLEQASRQKAKRGTDLSQSPVQELWDPRLVFRPGTSSTNFAEMFRILRASISLLGDETRRRITLFSSALPGEGKSLVSGNFALAAAGQGRKTLLIDLDLRKPNVHKVFGFLRSEHGPGVTEWLAGQASFDEVILRDTGAENLHIILSGKRAPNPGELLSVSRLKQLFAEARKHYDLVVIDTAPLLAVPDTRVIAPLADNFCLVVRSGYVPKGAVTRTLELLATAETQVSGIVFNGFKESRRMIGQNYSYGSYRMSRYGKPYQYGYGGYGSYGAYGEDESDEEKELLERKKRATKKRRAKTAKTDD